MSDLRAFLESHGIELVSRAGWGARAPKYRNPLVSLAGGVTHHSVTASSPEIAQVQGIQAYHMFSKGWSDIAYSILVGQSGKVYEGRSAAGLQYEWLAKSGGTGDPEDRTLLAICAVGNFEVEQPSAGMIKAYRAIYTWIASQGGAVQKGDRDYNLTACPGTNLYVKIPFAPLVDEDDMPLSDADLAKIKGVVKSVMATELADVEAQLAEVRADTDWLQKEWSGINPKTGTPEGVQLADRLKATTDRVRDQVIPMLEELTGKDDGTPG